MVGIKRGLLGVGIRLIVFLDESPVGDEIAQRKIRAPGCRQHRTRDSGDPYTNEPTVARAFLQLHGREM